MRIICDVDDVLADLLVVWLEKYNRDYDDNLILDNITAWDITQFVKPECGKKIFSYLSHPDLYDTVEPVPGAVEGVQALLDAGHEVIFVSAEYTDSKAAWMVRNGFIDKPGKLIGCRDKSLVMADLIIDDNFDTISSFHGYGILFDRVHNREYETDVRVAGWPEVIKRVERIAGMNKSKEVSLVPGIGKDSPIVTNEKGGSQSALGYRLDLIDPLTLFRLASILDEGARKYGEYNWKKIKLSDNLNHALAHIFAYLAGDTQDDHLGHAFCRLHFVLSQHLAGEKYERGVPDGTH